VFFRASVWDKVKADQIDVFAAAVFGYLEEIKDTKKTRGLRQLWRDVRKTDLLDRIDFDLTRFVEPVSAANLNMRAHPYAHADRDLALSNSLS
jgi:hypothetical protein